MAKIKLGYLLMKIHGIVIMILKIGNTNMTERK
jgi:hypothetical protein